jgi:hypothetical protein
MPTVAEREAKAAYKAVDAAWLAACRDQENSRAAELSVQRAGLLQLWKEEKAKSAAAWQEYLQEEEEAERREEAEAAAAAEAKRAALEEREEPPLDQVTVKRASQKRKRKPLSTPHVVTPPHSRSTLLLRLLQAVEQAGDAPTEQLVAQLRSCLKGMELSQPDASRPLVEGPGADLDLHGPLGPAEQGPDANRPAEQGSDANRPVQQGSNAHGPSRKEGSGPPRSPAGHEGTTTVLEVPAWSPGLTWEDALTHRLRL